MGIFTFWEKFTNLAQAPQIPTFLDKHQTYALISKDADGYINRLPPADLFFRNAPDADTYRRMSAKTAVSFHSLEREKLAEIAPPIDAFLDKYYAPPSGFRNKTPWVFALTEGTVYEQGEPHVRWSRFSESSAKPVPVLYLSTNRLAEILEDRCALGWELLYLRLAAVFPEKTNWNNGIMPWKLDDRTWKFRDRFTLYCDSWYKK